LSLKEKIPDFTFLLGESLTERDPALMLPVRYELLAQDS
jgi:hypothetical protein